MSRRLRWLAWGARSLLTLVLAVWLLLGLGWALIHGWIVPRIADLRPQLEQVASRALGLPVRIGQITATGGGWVPSFELNDVRLLDASGRPALQLAQVRVSLSPRSLLNRSFEQLIIEQPELDLRRTASGQLLVAGLEFSLSRQDQGHALADWFFSQPEFVFRGGTLHWTDELAGTPRVTLTAVDWVMRNPGRRHLMRLDATPPPAWGERFSARGVFRQPLLSLGSGQWSQWSGELYGEFSRADLAQLAPFAPLQELGVRLAAGQGSLRAWGDIEKGKLVGGTADLVLEQVTAQLGPDLAPLKLSSMAGRLGLRTLAEGSEWRTEGLSFQTQDGLRWPGGNVLLEQRNAGKAGPERHELKADKLDLAALALIADRLPLPAATREHITRLAPRGLIETLQAQWQGPLAEPLAFSASGRISALSLAAAGPAGNASFKPGRPGLGNAQLDFSLNQNGGQARLQLNQGWLELPGVFEEPRIPFDQLAADISVKRDGSNWTVDLRQVQLANADAQGRFQAHWQTSPVGKGPADKATAEKGPADADPRFPGVLDLQGQLSRGNASRVHRYLPLLLPESARQYVHAAVTQGQLSEVNVKIKGALRGMFAADRSAGPGKKPKDEFLITAKLKGGGYAYVPSAFDKPGSKPWPALTQVDANLVFDHASLQVNAARARLASAPALVLGKGTARVADLAQPVVEVSAELNGPLAQALQVVNSSPIGALTSDALAKTSATGLADYAFKLNLPVKNLARASVQGSVSLPGNDVQFTPDTPALGRLRGVVLFSEAGFSVSGAQARLLGGDIRFDGGSRPAQRAASGEPEVSFKGQGSISAEGLSARELGALSALAHHASGSTSYSASLGFRQGQAELSVSSNLQGLGLQLPAPLNKAATAAWPLRFDKTVLRDSLASGKKAQDQLLLNLGPGPGLPRPVQAHYVRDISGPQPQVLRGSLALGQDEGSNPLPAQGVRIKLNMERLDADAWESLSLASPAAPAGAASLDAGYLPTAYTLQAREFKLHGYTLNQVALNGLRDGLNWRAQVSANEVDGQLEFRQASGSATSNVPGRLFARLSRLSLGNSTAQEVETTLLQTQPGSVPALDIVVDELELRGKKLGRLEVEAVNRTGPALLREGGREWRLNKLNLRMPEASFSATGQWSALGTSNSNAVAANERRGTSMTFRLDIADSGELLKRLGMDGLIRRGRGRMEGQVGWDGSPLSLHYPTLRGQFNVAMESGQFLKADPGVAKLLGVLSLQALPRRLTLDFRDVFSEGFAFDFVRGDVSIEQGVARTNNLQMKGINAAVLMQGQADIARETQDLQVVVVPELNAGTASLIASTINPMVGIGTLLAQLFLRRPLTEAATQEFHITSTWGDPRITRVERKPARAAAPPSDKP